MHITPHLAEECTPEAYRVKKELGVGNGFDDFQPFGPLSDMAVHFIDLDGEIKVMLEIGARTTHRELRKALPQLLQWRDTLRKIQIDKIAERIMQHVREGETRWEIPEEKLETLDSLRKAGRTYTQLAAQENRMVKSFLMAILPFHRKRRLSPKDRVTRDFFMSRLIRHVEVLGVSRVDWEAALDELARGNEPFGSEYPISAARIQEALKQWHRSSLHKLAK